jgi:hypothetical protein
MSFKSLLIFTKASHFHTKASTSLKMNLKNLKILQNASIYLEIIEKILEFFEKALDHFKKTTIPLKMSSKSLRFLIKAFISLKMSSKSLNKNLTLSL